MLSTISCPGCKAAPVRNLYTSACAGPGHILHGQCEIGTSARHCTLPILVRVTLSEKLLVRISGSCVLCIFDGHVRVCACNVYRGSAEKTCGMGRQPDSQQVHLSFSFCFSVPDLGFGAEVLMMD